MDMAKKYDDDPDRARPPQRSNDERRIGQEKKTQKTLETKLKPENIRNRTLICLLAIYLLNNLLF